MFKLGLCSVTFRKLTVQQVIQLAVKAGLEGIEWGGDYHVPPGQIDKAKKVADYMKQASLEIVSYGSYYRVGDPKEDPASFARILETAVHLEAPAIRVWAGTLGSDKADTTYINNVVLEAKRIASLAQAKGISIHFEYHGGTLTDTKESSKLLMKDINHPNVFIYWQPAVGVEVNQRLESIRDISPWLSHVHVFQWRVTDRLPLSEGKEDWGNYLSEISTRYCYLLMEFVKEDSEEQFLEDARILHELTK